MDPIILKFQDYQATFLPDKGMNMISFKKGPVEIIDQSTKNLFDERYAGLGALIGPHFHWRRLETIPAIKDESLFPHVSRIKEKKIGDPFSHGIARYAPWKAEFTENQVKATLSGKDTWNNVPLADLEGQNFKMELIVQLKNDGLHLNLSIVSDTLSIVGIHYYYHLPNGKGKIFSRVKNEFINEKREKIRIPENWSYDSQKNLVFDLNNQADYTFHPLPNPLEGAIILETEEYNLKTTYQCNCEENGWQLYHPKDSSFVCIEPISAKNPKHPVLSVSSMSIHLEIT